MLCSTALRGLLLLKRQMHRSTREMHWATGRRDRVAR